MVKYQDANLDQVFSALSDATRREVLMALGEGSRSVTELALAHDMSLPGFMKHLRVLDEAGLITMSKEGRVVRCELLAEPMQEAAVWLSRYEKFWTERLDALGRYLYHQEEVASCPLTPIQPTPPAPARSPRSALSAAMTPRRKKSGGPGPSRKP